MRISILADSTEYCDRLTEMIRGFAPDATITEWTDPEDLVRDCLQKGTDLLYIYAESEGAVNAAEKISNDMPEAGVVLIARDRFYAMEALSIHAQGYVIEPVTADSLRSEYDYFLKRRAAVIRMASGKADGNSRIRFRMDGGFDCLMDGMPVQFSRSKTRDLMAYLAGKGGAMASDNELLMTLWGKENASTKSALRSTKAEMVNLFRDAGCEDAIVKHRGRIGIMIDKIN